VLQNSQNAERLIFREKTKQATIADQCSLKPVTGIACELGSCKCGGSEDHAGSSRRNDKKGDTLVLDVRDAPQVATSGKVAGAANVCRGMLEFRADPESPYHDKNFDRDKVGHTVLN
jgi:hypothetical protein